MTSSVASSTDVRLDRRKFVVGLLFGSAAAVASWRQPTGHIDYLKLDKLDQIVPPTIGRWKFVTTSGLVVPPEDQLSKTLYSQLLTRVYSDGKSPPIMLLVAQSAGQVGILQIHRPETCYPAGGYKLSPVVLNPITVGNIVVPVNSLAASADGTTERIFYWTRIGNQLPASWAQQRLAIAEQNLRGIIPDAILVRVSTIENDAADAHQRLTRFVQALIESIPAVNRAVFIV